MYSFDLLLPLLPLFVVVIDFGVFTVCCLNLAFFVINVYSHNSFNKLFKQILNDSEGAIKLSKTTQNTLVEWYNDTNADYIELDKKQFKTEEQLQRLADVVQELLKTADRLADLIEIQHNKSEELKTTIKTHEEKIKNLEQAVYVLS